MARMPKAAATDQPAQLAETNPNLPRPSINIINATYQPIQPAQVNPELSDTPAVHTDSSSQQASSQAQSASGAQQHVPSEGPSNLALLHQEFGLPSPLPSIAPIQGAPSSSSLLQPPASIPGISNSMTSSIQSGFLAPLDAAHGSNNHQVPPGSSALAQPPTIMPAQTGFQAHTVATLAPTRNSNSSTHGTCLHVCAACHETFIIWSELQYHLDECGHYMCSICRQMFSTRFDLNRHLDNSGHRTRPRGS